MTIDIVVGVLVAVFALYSYWKGLMRKLAGIGALVVASLGAGYVGREFATFAGTRWNISIPGLYIVCGVLGWIVLYVVGRIVLGYIGRKIGTNEEGQSRGWNKWLGALFGALEVVLLCWFIVAILDSIPEDVRARRLTALHNQMDNSAFAYATHATSPAALLELQPLIADVSTVAEQPAVLRNLEGEDSMQGVMQNEKVKSILADDKLMGYWRTSSLPRFFADPRVREALEDKELRDMLREADLRDTLRRMAEQAREAE